MNYKIIDNTILLSLKTDEYINNSIKKIFKKEKLKFGWINGIGAVHNIEIGCYDLISKKYIKKKILEECELLSMVGDITFLNNNYFIHTHITLSDQRFNSMGGHLFDAQIAATGEFKIDLLDYKINRKFSDKIGLNLWCIQDGNN